jgi:hypothetical protein
MPMDQAYFENLLIALDEKRKKGSFAVEAFAIRFFPLLVQEVSRLEKENAALKSGREVQQ